jgi:hypothetical protein
MGPAPTPQLVPASGWGGAGSSNLDLAEASLHKPLFSGFHRMESCVLSIEAPTHTPPCRGNLRVGEALTNDRKSTAYFFEAEADMVEDWLC